MLIAQVRPTFTQDMYFVPPTAWADGAEPGLYAVGYGDFVSRSSYRGDTDMNDLWRVYWIEAGEGFVQGADGRRRWLRGGDVFAMYPQRPYHREDSPKTPWRLRVVMFRGARAEEALRMAGLAPDEVHRRPGQAARLEPVFAKMREALRGEKPSLLTLGALAYECLAACESGDDGVPDAPPRRSVDNRPALAVEWLHRHYTHGVSVEDAAKAVGLSRSGLFRAFVGHTGQNPKAYLDHLRVEHARRLIAAGGYTIKEVAARSGFSDARHFARTYSRKAGESPRTLFAGKGDGPGRPDADDSRHRRAVTGSAAANNSRAAGV